MKLGRAVLITAGAAFVAVGAAVLFISRGPTQEYRACVALMWDRKHPGAVKQRRREADLRECETLRLRDGNTCDCSIAEGQPGSCVTFTFERPGGEPAENPCQHLSLEELRRADAEANQLSLAECSNSEQEPIPWKGNEACVEAWKRTHHQ